MGASESTQNQDHLQEQAQDHVQNGPAQLQVQQILQQMPQQTSQHMPRQMIQQISEHVQQVPPPEGAVVSASLWDAMTSTFSSPAPQKQDARVQAQASAPPALQRRSLPNNSSYGDRRARFRGGPPAGRTDVTISKVLEPEYNDDDQLDDAPASKGLGADTQPEPEATSAGAAALSVMTRVEYSALPRGTRQDVFGLVTVTAAEVPDPPELGPGAGDGAGEHEPMDIVCVLDVSSSMSGDKIRLLQEAVRFVIEQAHEKDRVSIATFNHSAARHLRLRRMMPEGKSEATAATLRLVANGGTSIAAGLDVGVSVMERRRSRNKVSAILLLTDGQDSSSRARIPELLSRCRAANCSLYAFGFGKDHDAALLSSIAEQAMTPFTFVEDVEHIRQAFAGTVGGLSSVVAQGIELTFSCHVALKAVHTPFVVRRASDHSATVLIPDIFGGESRDVLVELDVPMDSVAAEDGGAVTSALSGGSPAEEQPAPEQEEAPTASTAPSGVMLLEANVKYTDLRRNVLVQTPLIAMSTASFDEPQPELEPDEEVTAQRERVEVTRALRQAAEQSDRNDFDGARQVLESQASALKAKKKSTRMSPALLLELQDASSRMASRSSWERGGRAEVKDSVQMHSMQRCTNVSVSKVSAVQKCSKRMYISSQARRNISKVDGSDSDSDGIPRAEEPR